MTEVAVGEGAGATFASSWYEYLTTPTPAPDAPTAAHYVVAAVLADETIVKIDEEARYHPTARAYRSTGAKLELPESARGPDGVFTLDSGCYRVLSTDEYAEIKRVEAAAAEARAEAAVSSPRATRAALPPAPPVLSSSSSSYAGCDAALDDVLAQLSLHGDGALRVGCSAMAQMVTVIAVGPERVAAALKRVRAIGELARGYKNEVVTVILGIDLADDAEVRAALATPGRRVLLRAEGVDGDAEGLSGPAKAYLREAVPQQTFGRSAASTATDLWALPTIAQLGESPLALVGAAQGGVPLVDRTLRWRGAWPEPVQRWATVSGLGWAVAAWCPSVIAALRQPPPTLDLHTDEDELQYEVETTLLSLLKWRDPGGAQPFLAASDVLKGVLGPVLTAGRGGRQPMRLVTWSIPGADGGAPPVRMLLPETYVRAALADYASDAPARPGEALLVAQGFLTLRDTDAMPLLFEHLRPEEYDDERRAFGDRLWRAGAATSARAADAAPERGRPPTAFRTPRDALVATTAHVLAPGLRVAPPPEATYYVSCTSDDALCGLRVRWTWRHTAPHSPTLDVDTHGPDGLQLRYESF